MRIGVYLEIKGVSLKPLLAAIGRGFRALRLTNWPTIQISFQRGQRGERGHDPPS